MASEFDTPRGMACWRRGCRSAFELKCDPLTASFCSNPEHSAPFPGHKPWPHSDHGRFCPQPGGMRHNPGPSTISEFERAPVGLTETPPVSTVDPSAAAGASGAPPLQTEVLIIGAGPCGLFEVFELGL